MSNPKRIIKLKLNTISQNNLALVLSQHKINLTTFKEKLSKITVQFEKNFIINVNIHIYEGSKFELELLRPSTGFLLNRIMKHDNILKISDLYKICLLTKIKNTKNTKKIKILKGIIKCF